eukprot:1727694-Prymnesium_polylepis.1
MLSNEPHQACGGGEPPLEEPTFYSKLDFSAASKVRAAGVMSNPADVMSNRSRNQGTFSFGGWDDALPPSSSAPPTPRGMAAPPTPQGRVALTPESRSSCPGFQPKRPRGPMASYCINCGAHVDMCCGVPAIPIG